MSPGHSGVDDPILSPILALYDPATTRWRFSKDSDFWRTIAAAHAAGERGAGTKVAVIDGGFDVSIPALRGRVVHGANPTDRRAQLHGTIVVLLLLDVAPDVELHLYPVAPAGRVDFDAVDAALVAASDSAVINLSVAKDDIPIDHTKIQRFRDSIERWPDMTEAEWEFCEAEAISQSDRWSELLDIPPDSTVAAIRQAYANGATIVAASGNSEDNFYIPSADPSALSVGFHTEVRSDDDGRETAVGAQPKWYSQSFFVDFAIIQPRELIGSSFASPLLAAAAALMRDPRQMYAYRNVVAAGALAGQLLARPDGADWNLRQRETETELYLRALRASPHAHVEVGPAEPCTSCALWEAAVLSDFGLFHLTRYSFDDALRFLECAAAIAPLNPHARANLGMTFACHAARAVDLGSIANARALLKKASAEYVAAVKVRKASPTLSSTLSAYEERRDEFVNATKDPAKWRPGFRPHDGVLPAA